MIAFADYRPLILHAGGELSRFDRDWVLDSLELAFFRAGAEKVWYAWDVAQTVSLFISENYKGEVLPACILEKLILRLLKAEGIAEEMEGVAEKFRFAPPHATIDLAKFAVAAGSSFELGFFGILAEELSGVFSRNVLRLRCFGLEECVRILCGGKRWRKDCGVLREEIVSYIRTRLAAPPEPVFKIQFP